jgi:hypothetical protein
VRTLLRITIPVARGNAAIADGALNRVMRATMERIKPEAAYFATDGGKRSAFFVFDLADPADIPVVCEPLFRELEAEIELCPVMSVEDLTRGIAAAGQTTG